MTERDPLLVTDGSPSAAALFGGEYRPFSPEGTDRALLAALDVGDRARSRPPTGGESAGFYDRLVVVDDAAGSQFDALRALRSADGGPTGPVAAIALRGTGFHGHRGRPWVASRGNLHLSFAAAPRLPARDLAAAAAMLPAVAAAGAIRDVTLGAVSPGIKWVNDLLVEERKVAGVLTATQVAGERLEVVLFGIGMNVETAPVVTPTAFVPATARLADFAPVTLAGAARAVLASLAGWYRTLVREGPAPLLSAYRDAAVVIGRRVRIYTEGLDESAPLPRPIAEGVVREILPDLSLRLEGRREPVSNGRLAFVIPRVGEA